MVSKSSDNYISNRAWFRDIVGGEHLILCKTSALEFLELFDGYVSENDIYVYATAKGQYENINYHIVDSFNNIDYFRNDNVLCTTFNQTVNDMLKDENSDDQALGEALSNYYFSNNETFNGLVISPENIDRFNEIKEQAVLYYSGG